MGVIFTNGFGVGTVPNNNGVGGNGQWLLIVGTNGYQPAWDNGAITFPLHDISQGSSDPTDVFTHPSGIYLNGLDIFGNSKTSILTSAVGSSGTIRFSQGSTEAIFSFTSNTFDFNNFGASTGIYYDNGFGSGSGLTLLSSQNLPFNGFDGNGMPSSSQYITVTVNPSPYQFTVTSNSFDSDQYYGPICGNNSGDWNLLTGFTISEASNLWCGVTAYISGDTLTQIANAYTAANATPGSNGYIFDVVWGQGSTITNGIAKFIYTGFGNQIYITTVDPTDTRYLNSDNNPNNGTQLAGTFNFPATFTFKQPLDAKGGWC